MLDAEKIVDDTLNLFRHEIQNISEFISIDDYEQLHQEFLTPTSIKIDMDILKHDLESYQVFFQQWGQHRSHVPRYGIALVNLDGVLDRTQDPTNGSLYEWSSLNPDKKIIESDCVIPTELINLLSLKPLRVLDDHWCRSNILKWNKGAEFVPHIDNCVPAPWIRLWATSDADNLDLRFYNKKTKSMEKVKSIEEGRVYIIDTSIVHDAKAHNDNIYQLFLSTLPSSTELLKELINV